MGRSRISSRLGSEAGTPAADDMAKLRPGAESPAPEALKAFARENLLAYQTPVEVRIVDALPRTLSMKVSTPEVRALFRGPDGA